MALPTRNQVRTLILTWWQLPGRPRLARLRAQLTSLITPPHSNRGAVVVRIEVGPPMALVVELVTWDIDGNQTVANSLSFDATDIPPNANNVDFDDIVDDEGGKRSRRQVRDGGLRGLRRVD
jgi:hypothetical protein